MQEACKHAFQELEAAPIVYSAPLTAPLFLCFNWNEVFEKYGFTDQTSSFHVVAFRSVRKRDTDENALTRINNVALEEARKSGGLVRYWAGRPNAQRQCLEASVWESRAAAERAARRPAYAEAMKEAATLYESYTLERYSITATVDHLPAFKLIDTTSRYI
ncbi:hypothetical protein GOP47_0018128 [Adiantum capillus-veneris]|uniref:ABM domain-containing protein n=1 Tax=Adiantum capillus-veneris TaxID=13818 RepID=A0A9D4ZBJ3_ADICA|nr:hypothetical protein GOP47_0018128 [Adiantum capillus-veneris]